MLPSLDDLMGMEVSEGFDSPVPIGWYDAVITGAEVNKGKKAPYIKLEATIHDDEYRGRKVWKNAVSFSEKALTMPGGVVEVLQVCEPDIDRSAPSEELPALIAAGILSTPVRVQVEHEQVVRNGVAQFNADGEPEMRAQIRSLAKADEEFIEAIQKEAAGVDDDLPF